VRQPQFSAVLDACVLYPAPLRDLLMWLALSGLFRARWSAQIHDEWKRSLLLRRHDLSTEQLDRTSTLMNEAIPEALVAGHEGLIAGLNLPDPDDRHVLAAAIRCDARIIVTFNKKDFPGATLSPFSIEAQHPDKFVERLLELDRAAVIAAARRQRAQLKSPPIDVGRYLAVLSQQGLTRTVEALAAHRNVL
jgi:hypothetical protein